MRIDTPETPPDASASENGPSRGSGAERGWPAVPGREPVATSPLVELCRRTIDEVIEAWRGRHVAAVAELTLDWPDPDRATVRVGGHVLVPSQAAALERALLTSIEAAGLDAAALSFEVLVLTDIVDDPTWLRPRSEWIDVLAAPGRSGDLATQWASTEPPFRFLSEVDRWWAVELADRTVGWVGKADVEIAAASDRPESVERWRADWNGEVRAVPAGAPTWRAALGGWLDAPYRLGGRRLEGIDCSGLTQRIYRDVLGMGLPRHSKDQIRFGLRVGRFELAAGDLVYATHAERGLSHVAFVVSGVDDEVPSVGHAGLDHARVVEEPLSAFLDRYVFRAARRFPLGFRPDDPRPRQRAAGGGSPPG